MKKILFGCGLYGRMALKKFGCENVAFFVDNNPNMIGSVVNGIKVIDFTELIRIISDYELIISTKYFRSIEEQLKSVGISDYSIFIENDMRYYPTDEIILNPYLDGKCLIDKSEEKRKELLEEIDIEVGRAISENSLFNHVEIETINRCNGDCSFCPVNKFSDIRKTYLMRDDLFESIIEQLHEMNFDGRLALFSNNEPFLDKKIVEKYRLARKRVPKAFIYIYTNGILLTLEKFVEIIECVDEFVIDNYEQNLRLLDSVRCVVDYCEMHPELRHKLTVVLRKKDEVLTNRGGKAANCIMPSKSIPWKCVLPFKQLIVRPDGKVSLCCNDPYGENTMADLNKETLVEAWNNIKFMSVRKKLAEGGRKNYEYCKFCDVINTGM